MAADVGIWRLLKSLGSEMFSAIESDKLAALLLEFGGASGNVDALMKRIDKVKSDRVKLAGLLALPAVAQRSQEWFDLRKERLTASDASKALVMNRTRDALVRTKAFPETAKFITSAAMEWGKRFESMALRMYCARNGGVLVHEFGLIPHPTLTCFGASPDGITDTGVMIEIKCPYSREIKPDYIPDYYEVQMQGQMAVCELTECDYIECEIRQHHTVDEYIAAARLCEYPSDHGIVIGDEYSPDGISALLAVSWASNMNGTGSTGTPCMWTLRKIQVQRVTFDADRWNSWVPKIKRFWQDVLAARENKKHDVSGIGSKEREKEKERERVDFLDDSDDD